MSVQKSFWKVAIFSFLTGNITGLIIGISRTYNQPFSQMGRRESVIRILTEKGYECLENSDYLTNDYDLVICSTDRKMSSDDLKTRQEFYFKVKKPDLKAISIWLVAGPGQSLNDLQESYDSASQEAEQRYKY
ncbi:MAG: hypothetical protein ACRCYY_17475 [Trueperaceae bacterium]